MAVATTCSNCGTALSKSTIRKRRSGQRAGHTGLCGKCWHDQIRRPELRCSDCGAKLANYKAKRCQPCANRRMAADAEREARRLALSNEARKRPDVQARRKRANLLLAERKMRWCPVERRPEYFRLLKKLGTRVEAKAEMLRRMSPFERQMSLVMEGRPVVEKVSVERAAPAFTLGGVSAGWV